MTWESLLLEEDDCGIEIRESLRSVELQKQEKKFYHCENYSLGSLRGTSVLPP